MSDAPILIGLADPVMEEGDRDHCAGVTLATPVPVHNRPGLPTITYRSGDHGRFKASMLTGLGTAGAGPLTRLGTRADDDFTVALIDAFASVCEVLSFYQERLANEAFLGVATERASVVELARLIGYRLAPGAAAETNLVLNMDDPAGADAHVAELTVPRGTRIQSQPGPDETPQVFETLEDLTARVAWNALLARRSRRLRPAYGDTFTWLDGLATGLTSGDAILIVGRERGDPAAADYDVGSERWDFRRVTAVTPLPRLDCTLVTWDRPLGAVEPHGLPAQADHRIFHLRTRASLFGYNAPHPELLTPEQRDGLPGAPAGALADWSFALDSSARAVHLDAIHKGFVRASWAVIAWPMHNAELYRIEAVTDDGLTRYALSGRATRLTFDTEEGLARVRDNYRAASVYGESVELAFADTPLEEWVTGTEIEIDTLADLPAGRRLMATGRRATVVVDRDEIALGPGRKALRGTLLTLLAAPAPRPDGQLDWRLRDGDGAEFQPALAAGALRPVPAPEGTEEIAELVELVRVEPADAAHSRLMLKAPLAAAYDREGFRLHANIARASHGETATEILGSGDPARPFQRFRLKQNPVTHLLADTETGVASTLSLRVDGVQWTEMPDLHDRDPRGRVFATRQTNAGETVIQFGDGKSGARPPPGRDNILAEYRRGLGTAGNLRRRQLSLLLDRPLGLKEATNPLPASGGADAETLDGARHNAPIHTLTLGRVVSIADYRDFARGYPGISRADARWIWDGRVRRVVVSVAGPDGVPLPADGPTLPRLLAAMRALGDPLALVDIISYEPSHFRLGLKFATLPGHHPATVGTALEAALRQDFSFAVRDFAKPIALSAVAAAAHRVQGVCAVDIDLLYRASGPQTAPKPHALLEARPARIEGGIFRPAEILTLDPGPLVAFEAMS